MKIITAAIFLPVVLIAAACSEVPENEAFQKALERNGHAAKVEKPAVEPVTEASPNAISNNEIQPASQSAPPSNKNGSAVKWINIADMAENSFSVDMPAGWTNTALLHRVHGSPRSLVTAISPDKNTVIYIGDPRLPVYTVPGSGFEEPYRQFNMKYPYQVAEYVPAETYFNNYLRTHFGQIEGFRIIEKFDNRPLLALQRKEMQKAPVNAEVSNISYRFEYQSKGRVIHGELNGTVIGLGKMWLAEASGFCTAGDPVAAAAMMIKMMESKAANPQWQQAQQAQHQQTMSMIEQNTQRMTQQHQQNMANIQRSAAAHQQRMADLQQAADARNEQWRPQRAMAAEPAGAGCSARKIPE